MLDYLAHLLDTSGFPPRWSCGSWTAGHGWLHILSDLGVWSAYVAIPGVLAYFALRRRDIPFRPVLWLFGAFILACGTTHLMEAAIFWWPAYRLAGLIKLATAVVSWGTVLALVPVTPRALAMRSPEELGREIEERKKVEAELTRVNARLQASLAEKEVLLKEIHHRVKNNLQIISSLLHLQSQQVEDEALRERFREGQHRIRSLALVHERLYQSDDLARVNFADYLGSLAGYLFRAYHADASRVQLSIDVGDVRLPIHAAVPCGLAVSELVSNCLKHAFPGGRAGAIQVELQPRGEAEVCLCVRDDGVGLPAGLELAGARTFGLRLVDALVQQLHGAAELERGAGTSLRITFPVRAARPGALS